MAGSSVIQSFNHFGKNQQFCVRKEFSWDLKKTGHFNRQRGSLAACQFALYIILSRDLKVFVYWTTQKAL